MLLSVKSYTMLVFPVHIFHNKTSRESSVFAVYDLLNIHLTGNPHKVLLYCHVILFRNKPSQSCEGGSVQLIQTGREQEGISLSLFSSNVQQNGSRR